VLEAGNSISTCLAWASPSQIDLRLDGALLKRFTIGGEGKGLTAPESFAGNTQGDPGWEVYMHTRTRPSEARVPIKAGTREVGVSFVRQHWEPEGVLQPPQRGFAPHEPTNSISAIRPWNRCWSAVRIEAAGATERPAAENLRLPAGG